VQILPVAGPRATGVSNSGNANAFTDQKGRSRNSTHRQGAPKRLCCAQDEVLSGFDRVWIGEPARCEQIFVTVLDQMAGLGKRRPLA